MIEIPESVETWEETEKTIGETLPVIYGADAATLGWIRQWNEVIEADCPLYYDEELAQRLGYKTIPAPAGPGWKRVASGRCIPSQCPCSFPLLGTRLALRQTPK